jgi:hypothetical protein
MNAKGLQATNAGHAYDTSQKILVADHHAMKTFARPAP